MNEEDKNDDRFWKTVATRLPDYAERIEGDVNDIIDMLETLKLHAGDGTIQSKINAQGQTDYYFSYRTRKSNAEMSKYALKELEKELQKQLKTISDRLKRLG